MQGDKDKGDDFIRSLEDFIGKPGYLKFFNNCGGNPQEVVKRVKILQEGRYATNNNLLGNGGLGSEPGFFE